MRAFDGSFIKDLLVRMAIVCSLLVSTPVLSQTNDERPVILAVGESTTAGYGVPADQSYPAQLQRILDDHGYEYRVVNHGKSGSTVAMALTSLDRGLRLGPQIVLIAIGGNDAGNRVAVERTEQNLRKLVGTFVLAGATVYLADRTASEDRADSDVSLFAKVAKEEGAMLMPSLRQGLAGNPALLISDMSHPNADGYAIVSRRIFDLLQPQLVK
ncbi:MAG: GDSL-type esterase/lipase family protein [Pseudomonadota bacterium]